MSPAFAVEKVPRFSGASALAPLRIFAAAEVGANLVATDNLLFGSGNRFFLIFRHFHVPLSSVRGKWIERSFILFRLGRPG
jgi:hypothetical protein